MAQLFWVIKSWFKHQSFFFGDGLIMISPGFTNMLGILLHSAWPRQVAFLLVVCFGIFVYLTRRWLPVATRQESV
jgi:hypothetical protein